MKIGDKFKNTSGLELEIIDLQANGEIVWFKDNNNKINWEGKEAIKLYYTPITEPWNPNYGRV